MMEPTCFISKKEMLEIHRKVEVEAQREAKEKAKKLKEYKRF